jgi:spore coat polysaccharide biosynthesis protein SpsF
MLKTGIITQARMTSTRLPGKILLTAGGKTVLEHHLQRLAWSNIPVYVATTINVTDDPIEELVDSLGIPFYRGDEHNVLKRFYECAEKFQLDIIIRVTSDCPLVDGHIIAGGLSQYLKLKDSNAYYSNSLVRTFPRGLDFEIFSFNQLKAAYLHATLESDLEHVTPYINQNKSHTTVVVNHADNENHSDLRWTLDTETDWKLLQTLFDGYNVAGLSYSEILRIVHEHPELTTINSHIKQKEIRL